MESISLFLSSQNLYIQNLCLLMLFKTNSNLRLVLRENDRPVQVIINLAFTLICPQPCWNLHVAMLPLVACRLKSVKPSTEDCMCYDYSASGFFMLQFINNWSNPKAIQAFVCCFTAFLKNYNLRSFQACEVFRLSSWYYSNRTEIFQPSWWITICELHPR